VVGSGRQINHLSAGSGFGEAQAIRRAQSGPRRRSFVHGELLAQGEILDREPAVTAAEEREQPKQVEQESDHHAGSVSGSEPTDQRLARRPRFWRRTGKQYVVVPIGGANLPAELVALSLP
jgi:hypothetical protein